MVEYLDGGRIQGSSALADQTTVGTTFNLRFDFEVDSYPSGTGASGSYGLWSEDKGTDANTGGQDFVQLYNNDGVKHKLWVGKNTMAYGGSSTAIGGSWINLSIGTQYYVEIVGNGNDTYTLNIRTTSHSGSHVTGSPQTVDASSLSSLADMEYFGFKNTVGSSNGGTVTKIDNLALYNGTTSASGTANITDAFGSDGQWTFTTSEVDITGGVLETTMNRGGNDAATRTLIKYTDEKATITNVPAGTRYEETDTRKIYRFDTEVTPTLTDDITGSSQTVTQPTDTPDGSRFVGYHPAGNFYSRVGILVTNSDLITTGITSVKFKVWKAGSPTGDLSCKIYNGSSSLQYTSTNTKDIANDIDGTEASPNQLTWTFDGTAKLESGWYIVLEGGSYSSNSERVYQRWEDGVEYTGNKGVEYINGSWYESGGYSRSVDVEITSTPTSHTTNNTVDGWTTADYNYVKVNGSTDTLDLTTSSSTESSGMSKDIGVTLSQTAWVADIDFQLTATNQGSISSEVSVFIGIENLDSTSNILANHKGISFAHFAGSTRSQFYGLAHFDNNMIGATNSQYHVFSITPTASTYYYLRLSRTSETSAEVQVFSDSARTQLVEEDTFTVTSTLSGLRYIKAGTWNENGNYNGSGAAAKIHQIKIYNGKLPTGIANRWTERGTAP